MKRILLLLFVVSCYNISLAQGDDKIFQFEMMEDKIDLSSLSGNQTFDHFLGVEVGKKLFLLQETYTWRSEPDPMKPTPTIVIEKPEIYNNIKKLERYYKKGIKKSLIEEEIAKSEFTKILDIALQVRFQSTEDFESHLQSLKNEEEILAVFSQKVQMNYY